MYYFNGLRKFSRKYIQSAYLVEPKSCGLEFQVPFLYKHIWIELQGRKRVWNFSIYLKKGVNVKFWVFLNSVQKGQKQVLVWVVLLVK